MNIAIFAAYYAPHVGGYCKNVHELAKRLVDRGYGVEIITCNTEQASPDEIIDGVQITRLPTILHLAGQVPIPGLSKALLDLLREHVHDVAISQTRFFPTSVLAGIYAKSHRIPLVHVERGSRHSVLPGKITTALGELFDHTVGTLLVSQATETVGISQAACQFIKHMYSPSSPMRIPNGIKVPEMVASGYNENVDGVRVVFTGRLIYAKGVQDLIEAFDRAAFKRQDNLQLVIVGNGVYRTALEIQAARARCPNRITFSGEVDQSQIIDILSRCSILVNPSYSEGLPTTVMEAASVGLPIIATNVGGTNEIIRNGYSGFLIEPHDINRLTQLLEWILDNRKSASLMGNNARHIVQAFNWDDITDQWDNLLTKLRKK